MSVTDVTLLDSAAFLIVAKSKLSAATLLLKALETAVRLVKFAEVP